MKVKMEEMARDICNLNISCEECATIQRKMGMSKDQYCKSLKYAKQAYRKGYRKQSEGEWLVGGKCTACNEYSHIRTKYCCNCGAKMKGGAE